GNAQEMTITIVGEGAKEFGEFPLVEVGNYTYEITEVKTDAAGYTYDETVFVVVYKVSAHPTTNALVCNKLVNGKPVDGDYVSEVTFTNKYEKPSVSIDVSKVWADNDNEAGKRPDSITVKLIADGKETGKTLTLNDGVKWAGTFEDLDKFNAEGKEIVYLVQEVPVDGYTIDIFGDAATGFQIKNTIIEEEAPPTGVPAGLLSWICGLIGSMICLASFTVVLRKKKVEGR
ncbi:MAG: Cna B-type domain-containing protein, partial [Clostridia bacterium]|nr:Cna B-type domain-containing protein [Clostridia bacterium]